MANPEPAVVGCRSAPPWHGATWLERSERVDLGTTKMIARTEGGIGWMIFNQPEKHNAVSYEMWLAVPKIIADFEADPPCASSCSPVRAKRRSCPVRTSRSSRRSAAPGQHQVYDSAGEAAQSAIISHQAHHRHGPASHRRRPRHRPQHRRALCSEIPCSQSRPPGWARLQVCRHQAAGRHRSGRIRQGDLLYRQQVHRRGARVMGLVNRVVPELELEASVRPSQSSAHLRSPSRPPDGDQAAVQDPDKRRLTESMPPSRPALPARTTSRAPRLHGEAQARVHRR